MTGKKLKKTIDDKGIKQVWIANKLGIGKSLVSQWVRGTVPIPEKHSLELDKIFK